MTSSPKEKLAHVEEKEHKPIAPESSSSEITFGQHIRELRNQRGLSLKKVAELSGLNINTLSLIENGKISPSVSTLQQLAKALEIPMGAFFESEPVVRHVVFTSHLNRPVSILGGTRLENLGRDLYQNEVQPFIMTLDPAGGSGDHLVAHAGYEFVYTLSGQIQYTVDQTDYLLEPGDSLVFEAHLPHRWVNIAETQAQAILILYPAEIQESVSRWHF